MTDDDTAIQAHLAAMFANAPPHFSVEPERFSLVTFNPAFARYVREHYGVELRRGMVPEDMLPPANAAVWRGFLARALREGPFRTEYTTVGGQREMLLAFERLEHGGTTIGVAVLAIDMTENRRAMRAFAETQARLAAVVENTQDLIWSVDPERFGLVTFNHALADYFARGPLAIEIRVGMTPDDMLPPDFATRWHEFYARALREGSFVTEYETSAHGRTLLLSVNRMEHDGRPFGVSVFGKDITERKAVEAHLHRTLEELRALKDRLLQDNVALREQITVQRAPTAILGRSPAILKAIDQAKTVAPTDTVVLITGETGTGKELLARTIHEMSRRGARPMVTVNCAALPPGLIESELFGREKGAFTGAWTRQKGRFEAADGSSLFLDEIAELPLELQAKLLRVLQDGRFERLGSAETLAVNVRVIAATNRDLESMVSSRRFRADLFYRLRVFPIEMPPLRARRQDIPLLVWDAVCVFSQKLGKTIDTIPPETMQRLQEYAWPGNVRELRNVVERSVILSADRTLSVAFEPTDLQTTPPITMEDVQRRHVLATLERTRWRVGGPDGAASLLGVERSTLNSMMKRLGISRPKA